MQKKKVFALALILIVLIGLWGGYTLWHQRRLVNDNQLLANLKTESTAWEEELNTLENEQEQAEESKKNEESSVTDTSTVTEETEDTLDNDAQEEIRQETQEDFEERINQHNGVFASYLQELLDGDAGNLPKIEALWWQAKLYEKQENLVKAQESLQRIYENYPTSLRAEQAQLRVAILAYQDGNIEDAIANFDQLRAQESGVALAALLQLGLINMQLKDYAKARDIFEETLNRLEGRAGLDSWNTLVRNQLIALDVLTTNSG